MKLKMHYPFPYLALDLFVQLEVLTLNIIIVENQLKMEYYRQTWHEKVQQALWIFLKIETDY